MKNIKSILSVIVFAIASIANADYLYWMTESYTGTYTDDDYASLYVVNSEGTTSSFVGGAGYLSTYGYIVGATDVSAYKDTTDILFYIKIFQKTADDYKEVYNGYTQNNIMTYLALVENGYIRTATSENNANKMWDAVPEPTGGMLVLVGLALLGLKRKRQ